MAATPTLVDLAALDPSSAGYQETLDSALFQAVNIADSAKVLEAIKLGANPTSQQKKGRTGTTHALLVAVQNITDDGASDKVVSELLKAQHVRPPFCALLFSLPLYT